MHAINWGGVLILAVKVLTSLCVAGGDDLTQGR